MREAPFASSPDLADYFHAAAAAAASAPGPLGIEMPPGLQLSPLSNPAVRATYKCISLLYCISP